MKTFKDNQGRQWSVVINVNAIKRVRSLIGINLLEVVDGELLEQLITDPVLLCDVIYALCKPQADAAGVSDEQFGQAMAGDAIDAATTAVLEELVDFFPSAKRQVLSKALAKLKKLEQLATEIAVTHLDSEQMENDVRQALQNSNDLSGSSPGPPELHLAR